MEKKKTGYVIPHTHWDREWRYPVWENRIYLRDMMEELLDNLEQHADYKTFLLDGQTVAAQDFLEICPWERERLEALIRAGRIQVGPWYTLPDLYPVSGEAIVRNLLKGKAEAEKLGGCLTVGYESFGWGQPSQLPQIYKGFGIDTVIISKNVDKSRAPESEFRWIGADGTEVLATRLGDDARANFFMNTYLEIMTGKAYKTREYEYQYGNDGQFFHQADGDNCVQDYFRLENTERIHRNRIKNAIEKAWNGMRDSWLTDDRAMMDGTDSTTSQPMLQELLAEINAQSGEIEFRSSSITEYVDVLKEKLPHDRLREIHGELRDGPTTSLSGNALMTRPHIKMRNKKVQSKLFSQAEPSSVAVWLLGEKYEEVFLDKALDYMLLSHPHDSINGVTQDKTVEDVMYRLAQAEEIADVVYNRNLQKLIGRINFSGYTPDDILLVVFNPSVKPRSGIIKAYIDTPQDKNIWDFQIMDSEGERCELQEIERKEVVSPMVHLHARPYPFYADRHGVWFETGVIPAGGYQVYSLTACNTFDRRTKFWAKTRKTKGNEIGLGCDRMDNGILDVRVNGDGSLTVHDKRTSQTYGPVNYYESTGDVGDYWMYYPPYHNETYTSKGCQAILSMKENGPLSATVAAEIRMELPKHAYRPENYIHGESRRSDASDVVTITTCYTLQKGSSQVDVEVMVDNHCEDHRMSVIMDVGADTSWVDAEGHFTVDRRSAEPLKDSNDMFYNELTTQPMQSFVSVYDGKRGMGVLTDCLGEYELRKSGALALTLFRAVRTIICTEFRSEGYFPDQNGGQLQQVLEYRYALAFQAGTYEEENFADRAEWFRVPLKPVQTNVPNAMKKEIGEARNKAADGNRWDLSLKHSFYEVKGNVSLSCLKKAENDEAVILRLYNPGKTEENAAVTFAREPKAVFLTDLKEEVLEKVEIQGKTAVMTMDAGKICTWKLFFS